ncbi:hypothetical protein COJ85_03355 [Bacillus sp. AFS076308]|uniref:GvpL/GvpF family gas vesicle protein n=1 Tax=unclassified Bacillus (in: firmicutes) TaxID=185979 RepID=UPI000BF30788|nr:MULTISPECIES: GvpL/GvpF family gas vesicle protein [unclassified Bacillus (in: firmicutes)]PFO08293.1 hypothetical protein COJ85_03355 [Bacillus sp. AFS076308]PGV50697.1 hypothetical protein COD92_17335 [Bacillus sp. AFS037270]
MASTRVSTDFLYLYGVILAKELQTSEVPSIMGIDGNSVIIKHLNELAAIITTVNAQHFSQEQIDLQIKDADWLKEKAFHHHEIISTFHKEFTVLPMSFCTVFQNTENLETILNDQYPEIYQMLLSLKDKQEWNLKVYCQVDKTLAYVYEHNSAVVGLKEKLTSMPKGKQYIMKKKLEQLIASEVELEQSKWWQGMSEELSPYVGATNLRKIWGRDVTDRIDDMMVNCDFLVDRVTSSGFLHKLQDLEKKYEALGCSFHITGPWPPYHFSKIDKGSP